MNYNPIAKTLHWLIAPVILVLLAVGNFMAGMDASPQKFQIYALHKSFGILVLMLTLLRLSWRFIVPPPGPLETHQRWEILLAKLTHGFVYALMIALPLSGWIMSSAKEFPVPFFGLFTLPALAGKDEFVFSIASNMHGAMATILFALITLHIAGALKHHIIDRDETLHRMTSLRLGLTGFILLMAVLGLLYAAVVGAMLTGEEEETKSSPPTTQSSSPAQQTSQWIITPQDSAINFTATQYGVNFTGQFPKFDGIIIFDPDDLSSARADITIDLSQIKTGSADRDEQAKGAQWFNAAAFPTGRFTANQFTKTAEENDYLAQGTLTLRGIAQPISLPFTLTFDAQGAAHMKAALTLSRLDYGIGQGQWADEKAIGNAVNLAIAVTAYKAAL